MDLPAKGQVCRLDVCRHIRTVTVDIREIEKEKDRDPGTSYRKRAEQAGGKPIPGSDQPPDPLAGRHPKVPYNHHAHENHA